MQILPRERNLLAFFENRAQATATEAARALTLPTHQVHYALSSLIERKLILGRVALLNPRMLGLNEAIVYFSLQAANAQQRKQMLTALAKNPCCVWLAEVGGIDGYALQASVRSIEQLEAFLNYQGNSKGAKIFQRRMAFITQFFSYGRKYLAPTHAHTLSWKLPEKGVSTPDAVDLRILTRLSQGRIEPVRELARALGLAFSTADRRIKAMEHQGLIVGYLYGIAFEQLGVQRHKIQIAVREPSLPFANTLERFCREHPLITHLFRCIGAWDFEITLEASVSSQVADLTSSLQDHFGNNISSTISFPVFRNFFFRPLTAELKPPEHG
jgi:DNA-binding Lrp family transcriptional regulator